MYVHVSNVCVTHHSDPSYSCTADLDQLASFYAEVCHTPGLAKAGVSWADGSRQIAQQTIRAIGPGKVLISESNAEAYLGSLHAYLAIYGWKQCQMVPGFQAVYGGWSVNIGAQGWPNDAIGMRALFAQQFVLGHVLGWLRSETILSVLNSTHDRAFLRSLAQLKLEHTPYLIYGRLMHPPDIKSSNGDLLPVVSLCTQTFRNPPLHCCNYSAVVAHVWMATNQSLGVAAANTVTTPLSVTFTLRVDRHMPFAAGGQVRVVSEDIGLIAVETVSASGLQIHTTMPALSACVIRVEAIARAKIEN